MKLFSRNSSTGAVAVDGTARIEVDGGYRPAEVVVDAGSPVRLIFHRHDSSPCSEQVVFPQLGLRADLPQHTDVTVELPATEPGEYDFECGMGMLRGRVIAR